jgi:hypothetical protein
MGVFNYLIKKSILKSFFKIDLSNNEKEVAIDSIKNKYLVALRGALLSGLFTIPAILFLDTNVLISILIPITMVAGTAWFAISLANVKKKFEDFGLELTTNMFDSFVTSLILLGLLAMFSLLPSVFAPISTLGATLPYIEPISGVLGLIVVFRLIYNVFSGALKYDMNDAMLAGQNEVAERFFKKSLSLLHSSSENLRDGKGLEVANYYIGLSFYEIFAFIRASGVLNGSLSSLMKGAHKLKMNPAMGQEEADKIAISLIEKFASYCNNVDGHKAKKSFENIKDELRCLKENKNEPQMVVDTRLSTIFEEIAELLESEGDALFRSKN